MKKKYLTIAKKAMVWSLAASMLFATPLTASAEGLNDVFKVEDQWGEQLDEPDPDNTATGTVSSTSSRSAVAENEQWVTGIVLSETDVNLEMYPGSKTATKKLTATILVDNTKQVPEDKLEDMYKALIWRSNDNSVVAPETKKDGNVTEATLNAKKGGKTTVTVSLDNFEEDIHFTATANVSVKEYATALDFSTSVIPMLEGDSEQRNGYLGHSVDLNKALVKTPSTANDEITFEIVGGYDLKTKKSATNTATLKNGILTYKKAGNVRVVAVGERGARKEITINIDAGTPASKIEIWKDAEGQDRKLGAQKLDVAVAEQRTLDVVAKMWVGKGREQQEVTGDVKCTDVVTWESSKPAIVKIDKTSGNKATLKPVGVGKAVITAKTSTGKKTTLAVTVDATLTKIELSAVDKAKKTLYSGQSITLKADQYFGDDENAYVNFPGAGGLKWALVDQKNQGKYAKIKKDVLTLQPAVDDLAELKVTASSAKKYGKPGDPKSSKATINLTGDPLVIEMKQVNVDKIVVVNTDGEDLAIAAKTARESKNNGSVKVTAGKYKTFTVTAYNPDGTTNIPGTTTPLATTLSITTNNAKLAGVDQLANGDAKVSVPADAKKGKATITVSGATLNKPASGNKAATYKAIKTTFKAEVNKPVSAINLTCKDKVIKATLKNNKTKAQSIAVTAKFPNKEVTTSNAKNITWTAKLTDAEGKLVKTIDGIKNGAKGTVKLGEGEYAVGQTLTVTANLKDAEDKSSVSASVKLLVVTPSTGVQILNKDTGKPFENSKKKVNQAELSTEKADDSLQMVAEVNVSADKKKPNWVAPNADEDSAGNTVKAANVTYSVNKKGIVSIVDGKVTPIKAGTVKITATTTDGKKAVLTVTVVNK